MRWYVYAFFLFAVTLCVGFALGLIEIGTHDDDVFLSVMAGVSALVVWIPRRMDQRAMFGLTMMLSWIGTLGPYRAGFGYDSFVHFATSIISVLLIASMFRRPSAKKTLIIAVILTLACGIIVELFEYVGDRLWQTQMSGEAGQPDDTMRDLIYDVIGTGVGAFVLSIKDKFRV